MKRKIFMADGLPRKPSGNKIYVALKPVKYGRKVIGIESFIYSNEEFVEGPNQDKKNSFKIAHNNFDRFCKYFEDFAKKNNCYFHLYNFNTQSEVVFSHE